MYNVVSPVIDHFFTTANSVMFILKISSNAPKVLFIDLTD